jgi:para-nitrobenzyl esterase
MAVPTDGTPAAGVPAGSAPPDGTPVVVPTTRGALAGAWHDGVARFAGIPFAAPPVGDLRFRPPAPPIAWDGERDATRFGPVSAQNPSLMDALFGGEAEPWSEDCLHLNVWTPDPTPGGDEHRPVMVWIHGGGFEMGSGSSPLYHGASFARSGVVLVSLNYRLGSLGFLELGQVDPAEAGSGNVGLLDQVAALEWVRDNIASFGGDPANVTVFGESAGAMSVSLLLSMPAARGLFHKAIAQSGSTAAASTPEHAAANAAEFMDAAGLSTVDELRAAPVEALLAAHATMGAARMSDPEGVIERTGNPLAFLPFRPVADGREVPTDPLGALAGGASAGVPLLIGTNMEEWKLFALMTPAAGTDDELHRRVALITDDPDRALEAYRSEHPGASLADLESAVLTDAVFRIPAGRQADAHAPHAPVWQYRFDWRSPAWGGMIGSAHALEIPFVFDLVEDQRLHVFVGPEAPRALARSMHEAWIAFARDGVPAADGVPEWPTVDGAGRPVVLFDTVNSLVRDPDGVTRRFWDTAKTLIG